MQRLVIGVLAVAAVAGWVAAYVLLTESRGIGGRLEAVQAERAKLKEELDSARSDLKKQIDSAGRLDEIDQQVKTAEARVSVAEEQLRAKQQELTEVSKEAESRRLELSKLESQISEKSATATNIGQEVESAEIELKRLRAQIEDLEDTAKRPQTESLAKASPEVAGTPKAQPEAATMSEAEPGAAEPQETDKLGQAKRRFQLLDQNGDGSIDQFEFRLNSIKLLSDIDANDDGSVTIDETVLPPEQFRLLDQNGDGKISPIEFVEAFRIVDKDKRGAITLEEYLDFVQAAAK